MKYFWSNSKEKLVSAEEGKIGASEVADLKNGACKKLMQLVQFILVVEIALFLGWAAYSLYQAKYLSSQQQELHSELNPVNEHHHNNKLNLESPNKLDYMKWQEKSGDSPLNSEPHSTKTQIVKSPDSSTERDSVLLNTEDCVNHSELTYLDETTPLQIETSTSENNSPTTNEYKEQEIEKKSLIESQSLFKSRFEESSRENDDSEEKAKQNIHEEWMGSSPAPTAETAEVQRFEGGEVKDEELKEEYVKVPSSSPFLIVDTDSGMEENINDITNIKQEMKQELEEVMDEAKRNEVSVPKFIQLLHDLDRAEAEAKEQISPGDTPLNSGVENVKRYHFQISLGSGNPESGEANENSQVSDSPVSPFHFLVFFNMTDPEKGTSMFEKTESGESPIFGENSPSEVNRDVFGNSWKIEIPIPQDEQMLKWWVNTPEFQNTRKGGADSEEEFQSGKNNPSKTSTLEESLFNFMFDKPNSQNIPEIENVYVKNMTETASPEAESLETAFSDLLTSILDRDEDDDIISERNHYPGKPKDTLEPLGTSVEIMLSAIKNIKGDSSRDDSVKPLNKTSDLSDVSMEEEENSEDLGDLVNLAGNIFEKMMKENEKPMDKKGVKEEYEEEMVPSSSEDHEIMGSQTEKHVFQEESTIMKEETVSEEEPERDLSWTDGKNWFHYQPTWNEDSKLEEHLNRLNKDLKNWNSEDDESLSSSSSEYLYEY